MGFCLAVPPEISGLWWCAPQNGCKLRKHNPKEVNEGRLVRSTVVDETSERIRLSCGSQDAGVSHGISASIMNGALSLLRPSIASCPFAAQCQQHFSSQYSVRLAYT